MSKDAGRRPDIDLLRAVAVLSVIFYHFKVPGFSGGFLGVDVFFVISGYLITQHVNQQLEAGSFSFAGFYARRIRRLAPALAATMVLSSIAALAILPRDLLLDYAHSQLASALYVSNIYFWSIADYFDTSSYLKPLLHTWSLSVEEQFYLVWPVMLFVLGAGWRYRAILVLGIVSLVAAEWVYGISSSTTFYMFPFRIFEFAVGALLGSPALQTSRGRGNHALLALAAVGLLGSLLYFDTLDRFPGLLSLPVCLSTALIIWLRHPALHGRGLLQASFLRVGLISYSAYLLHWPVVVFYGVLSEAPLRWLDILLLLAVTLGGAEVLYRLVEQPTARLRLQGYTIWYFAALLAAGLAAWIFVMLAPWVYQALRAQPDSVQAIIDNTPVRKDVIPQLVEEQNFPTNRKASFKLMVVGDSHAEDMAVALAWALQGKDISVVKYKRYCEPLTPESVGDNMEELYRTHRIPNVNAQKCQRIQAEFLPNIEEEAPDLVVFSEQWREEELPYIAQTIRQIREATGAQVLVLGPNFEFIKHPKVVLGKVEHAWHINAYAREHQKFERHEIEERLRKQLSGTDAHFISKFDLVCPNDRCDILLDGQLAYLDYTHWSVPALRLFGERLANHPVFSKLTPPS
ncbi:acyltransferase [Mangrovimicrobium sediminis]|uniref:Acyltransferase n=1 Tax=Mangrovimicrobium sediminis TaxID=2562682 RepID=A0A4Z0LXE1_9GAMM|nr:acyltransferase family protein [Haliea sp. SAOS-164]TGD71818.1 acyltransferase [Haliea sp. SAOS-164]